MIALDVKVVGLQDPPPWPHIKPAHYGKLEKVGVLQAGMASGKTSLYLIIKTPIGYITAETSLDILNGLTAIANGADKRFKEDPAKN